MMLSLIDPAGTSLQLITAWWKAHHTTPISSSDRMTTWKHQQSRVINTTKHDAVIDRSCRYILTIDHCMVEGSPYHPNQQLRSDDHMEASAIQGDQHNQA